MTQIKLISDLVKIIKNATNEIAKDNYDVKLPINSNDEIGEIAKSFNYLVESLKAKKYELDQVNQLCLKTELKYRNLYDNSPDLYRSVNADEIITECNRAYAEQLGYTRDEVIGASVFDHLAENSLGEFRELTETWKKEGRVFNKEIWLKRKNGTTFPVLLSSTGLHDSSGKLIGSNTVIKDITDIYEARKKIEQSKTKPKGS